MMTLANYGLRSNRHKDPSSSKSLGKSLQIRNKAELLLKQCLKSHHRLLPGKRSEIMDVLQEYYSRVPFGSVVWNKFQIKQCIVDSILLLDTRFNPYKAKIAFQSIEEMLMNLVYTPWLREFRRIYTYSGQFRLIVSDPLIGIEEVLRAAGFDHDTSHHRMHLVLPDKYMPQVDPNETVIGVIFDCLLAQVVLQDIINVFENCQKTNQQRAAFADLNTDGINFFSWIKNYLNNRSESTTEQACSKMQEQLNNITNYLTRHDFGASKIPPKAEQFTNAKLNNDMPRKDVSSSIESCNSNASQDNLKHAPSRLATQQQARKFLSQKPLMNDSLLKLTDEQLVNFPEPYSVSGKKSQSPPSIRTHEVEIYNQQRSSVVPTSRSNAFGSSAQHIKPIDSDNFSSRVDTIDHYPNTSSSMYTRGYPLGIDMPHNDREPLLVSTQHQKQNQYNHPTYHGKIRTNNDFSTNDVTVYNGTNVRNPSFSNSKQRPYVMKPHPGKSPAQNQVNQQAPILMKTPIQASRFENSSYSKYELREPDRVFNQSNKSQWSCESCTYRNQTSSEICEMCGSRRLSR